MRIVTSVFILIMLAMPVTVVAVEPVNEAHAMVYYQFSPGAKKSAASKHSFGFRMDRATYQPGQMIEYRNLLARPAAIDLRFNQQGMESFTISGIDYLQKFRLHRASEEGGEDVAMEEESAVEGEEAMAEDAAAETEKKPGVAKKVITDVGEAMDTVLLDAPKGVLIGVGIAIVLAAGVGG